MTVLTIVSYTGCGDTKDAAQTDRSYAVSEGLQAGDQSAESQGADALYADFDQAKGAADSLYNNMQFRDAYDLYLKLLDSEEAQNDSEKRLDVLNCLCMTSELAGHKVDQHKWLEQLHDLAEQTGNDYYQSLALITMGQNIFFEGNHAKGIQYVNEAISLMGKTDRGNTDHLTHGFLNLLASLYSEMKDYDSALLTCERNLLLTMQGTRWGPAQNQQLIDRRMALAKKAALLARMGINSSGSEQRAYFQRADSAYAAWQAVQYEGNHTRDYFIVDYMKRRGLHREAVSIYNGLIERIRLQGDTLGEMMNTAKWGLADVCHQMGNSEQAATLYEEVLEIRDTLMSRKARNTAQELAAIYHAKEQEQKIMEQKVVTLRQQAILIFLIVILLGVSALAVVIIRKNRTINQKNRILAKRIAESINYKKLYWEEKQAQVPVPTTAVPDDLSTLSDKELFQHIDEVIVRERLFLDADFGRKAIMDRFSLPKERVGAVFSKESSRANLTSYIQKLRLEYAAKLLIEQPDKNIVQIAEECGFSTHNYFSLCFRQHFGMPPTNYRREALEPDA